MNNRTEELICKSVDGLATSEERAELARVMIRHPEVKQAWDEQATVLTLLARARVVAPKLGSR
ncbi:MAG: hypothetical protein AAF492_17480 [Verrucomicrobiota bacterium]